MVQIRAHMADAIERIRQANRDMLERRAAAIAERDDITRKALLQEQKELDQKNQERAKHLKNTIPELRSNLENRKDRQSSLLNEKKQRQCELDEKQSEVEKLRKLLNKAISEEYSAKHTLCQVTHELDTVQSSIYAIVSRIESHEEELRGLTQLTNVARE